MLRYAVIQLSNRCAAILQDMANTNIHPWAKSTDAFAVDDVWCLLFDLGSRFVEATLWGLVQNDAKF